jgi:BON domain-containing protein
MKNTIFYACLVTQLFLSGAVIAAQVSSSSGGARVVGPAVQPLTPSAPPPGTVGGKVSQPQNGNQMQMNQSRTFSTNNLGATTNGMAGTNGIAGGSNNSPTVTATVNPMTNGAIIGSNTDINGNVVLGDQAVTSSDRVLLTTLSQGVRATLGITPNGNLPVHFMINNGTVTVVGTVQSSAQSQDIIAKVQQTPGVIGVVSDLRVANQPGQFGIAQPRANSAFAGQTDHAFSARDQTLLTTVQQQAAMQLGINDASQMPVHFSIENGIVGVIGQVSSLQEKQALLAAISKTPGIVRVVDNVGVVGGAAGLNNGLPATSRDSGQSNTMFLNTTNPSGF